MNEHERIRVIRDGLRRFNRRAGVLKSNPYGIGLSLSQSSALVDLERLGPQRSNDFVRLLNLEKSSVSRLASALVQKRLVIIKADKTDGRIKILSLTANGKKAVALIHQRSNKSVEEVFEFLSVREQEEIALAFEKLANAEKAISQNKT